MRGVTFFSYRDHVFDMLTEEYDIGTSQWSIRVTTTSTAGDRFNGKGQATAYEEAARAAVKACIAAARAQRVFSFDG